MDFIKNIFTSHVSVPTWLFLLAALLIIIAIVAVIVWYYVDMYLSTHKTISTYADIPLSMKNNAIYINCVNLDKYPELWEAHESDLSIYAMGMKIPSIFFKSPDVPSGYKIAYSSTLTNQQILSLMAAVKYSKFEISSDDGHTRFPIKPISDKAAKKVAARLHDAHANLSEKQKEEVLQKIKESAGVANLNALKGDRILSHVNEGKTTSTTMRYQAIIPDNHPIHENGFTPESMRYYYSYFGKLYQFDMTFVSRVENLYEWELRNLQPNSIYVGFSHSIDGGKTLFPSTSMYGITKNEDGSSSDISNANLGVPPEGATEYPMWTFDAATSYMDIALIKKTCDVIVKKHHEHEFEDDYVAMTRVDEFYSRYEWVPQIKQFDEFEKKEK